MRPPDHPPAELAVEADRPLVVGQRPDDKGSVAVALEILARGLEHAPPESAALALGRKVELEDLPAVAERRDAVAAVADVADHRIAVFEHQQRRAARNRHAPPRGAATRNHPLELTTGNDAAICLA